MPSGVAARLLWRTMARSMRSWFSPRNPTAFFFAHALPQRFHKIHNVRRLGLFWTFDLFALLFLVQQLLQGIFISIFKLFWVELAALGVHDMGRKLEHVLRDLFVLYV